MIKKICLCFGIFTAAFVSAQSEKFEMGNQYLRLLINPVGGRIEKLYFKPEKLDLTSAEGLLGDNFHHVPDAKFFLTRKLYDYEAGTNSIRLQAHHTGGGIDFMALEKTIRLPENEATVTVDYSFTNLPAAMADIEYGYWCQNFSGVPDKKKNWFFPCLNGIAMVAGNTDGGQYSYYKQPSRGWVGFAYHDGGGLAMTMDYALVNQFYGWFGSSDTTLEWYFDKIKIPVGKSLDTSFEFIPFTVLKKISGAGGGLVGDVAIDFEKSDSRTRFISFQIYSGKKQQIKLEVTARHLRDGKPVKIAETRIDFEHPCIIKNYKLTHQFNAAPALFDIEARAYDVSGKQLAIFNAPVGIGMGTLSYRMQEEIKRDREKKPQIDLSKFDNTLNTPHIEWAKPLVGGKIKIFGLTSFPAYRELAELAQRLDVELSSTLWLERGRPSNVSGKYFGLLTESDIMDNLDNLLLQEYDVIVLAGINYDKLGFSRQQEILHKVKAGCGLVLISCGGESRDIPAISPFPEKPGKRYPKEVPRKVQEGFLSTAVPWDLIPATLCSAYESKGDVYAKVGNFPYLAMCEYGAGRVIALSYAANGGQGKMVGGITPELDYPLPGVEFKDYFELYQLILAKAVAAAAKRDHEYQFGKITATHENDHLIVKITFRNKPATAQPMILTTFARNRDNQELTRSAYSFESGDECAFKIPARNWGGKQLLGLILRNGQGEVLDFGAVSMEKHPSARITGVLPDKVHYQEGDHARFEVNVSGPDNMHQLTWNLKDAYGRIISAGKCTAREQNIFEVPIVNNLKMRSYVFTAELLVNEKIVDRLQVPFFATPSNDKTVWDDYEVGLWITPHTYDALRGYLQPFLADKMHEMKIATVMGNIREVDQKFAMRYNFNPTLHQGAGTRPASLPEEYRKSNNKMLLQRNPCLSSPDFRSEMRSLFENLGRQYQDKGLRYYWFGDELSLTGYWSSAIDYCFSPSCLEQFRRFLLDKYGSLNAINKQWETNYKNINEVLPDTAHETRRRKNANHSAWADHLEYMDRLLCEYIDFFTGQGLRSGDPEALGFISGPQGPSAYGGNNWYLQSKAYSGLMSYPWGGLQEILHSFHPGTIDLPWILGYANFGGTACYELWKSLAMRAKGAMAFAAANMINPDFTLSESGRAAAEYLPEITDGIGKLVLNALAERPAPEIMIVYSQPSIRSAFIQGRAREHENLRWKYVMLCRNFGIPFRFVADDQIEKGMLAEVRPALVVFPDANALSDGCLKQIGDYVKRGGKVLSEGNFFGMDASCREIPKRALPPVQRIGQAGSGYYDAWSKPLFQRNENDWKILDNDRRAFAEVLKYAGIVPLCRVLQADGTPFLDAELDIMADRQGNRYVLVISKEENPADVKLEFSAGKYVRDIRGAGSRLVNSNPIFVALLEAREDAPLSLAAHGAGREFELNIDAGYARDTVIRLTVTAPDGREVRWYNANLNAPLGKASHKLRFALNDLPGEWKICAREIVSGRTAETIIRID